MLPLKAQHTDPSSFRANTFQNQFRKNGLGRWIRWDSLVWGKGKQGVNSCNALLS
jgi:hypothetical protein